MRNAIMAELRNRTGPFSRPACGPRVSPREQSGPQAGRLNGGRRGPHSLAILACAFSLATLTGCPSPEPEGAVAADAGPMTAGRNALAAHQFDAAVADADDYLRAQPHGPSAAEALYIKGAAYQFKAFADAPADHSRNLFEARSAYLASLNERPPTVLEGYVRTGLCNVALYEDDFYAAIEQAQLAIPLVDRPATKAGLTYDMALAEQRQGRFTEADQAYGRVVAQYPGTPLAAQAALREHQHEFYVQLATYPTPADADRAILSLRAGGSVVSRGTDAAGRTKLDLGPFSTYDAAKQQRDAMVGPFPGAAVFP
jgi:tetratricopeptide (TPR) repeat protein